jgi:hypothetical protein
MVQEQSPPVAPAIPSPPSPAAPAPAPASATPRRQAVTGVIPPSVGEGLIREVFPTLVGINPGLAHLARSLIRTVVLAPVGFLLAGPLFALKIAPFLCKRYTLTNRRLMIQHGLKPKPAREVQLADIDEVRFDPAGVDPFYISGTLEIISKGQVVLTLPGVPEPEGFRHAILNAVKAWVPGKAAGPFQPASAVK